jgi:hypothetical protein
MEIKFNINEKTGCHEVYSHKTDSSGYPIVKKNNKSIRIHRYNYQLKNGVIPRELVVRHICDNKMCVNVDHLLIGTHADNVKDRVDRDRSACGEYNGRSKLTNEAVVEIFKDNNTSKCALAKKYNVDEKTIRKIKNRTTWKKATMFI